jgi:uncharacterized protein involved in exopolysaccharide biosynthesis
MVSKKAKIWIEVIFEISKYFKYFIFIELVTLVLAVVYVQFIASPVYISSSKIMSASTSGGGQANLIAAQFGIALPGMQKQMKWAYPEIIKSRILLKKIINQKFTTKKFGKEIKLISILTDDIDKKLSYDKLEDIAIQRLKNNILVTENVKTGILSIQIKSFEGTLSESINRSILETLDKHQSKFNQEKVSKTRIFVEERIEETFKELKFAEENLKNFNINNRQIDNSPSLLLEQMRLEREASVLTGVFTSLKQQLETTKIEEVKDSDYVIYVDYPSKSFAPIAPQKKLILILSLILGGLISLVLIKILSFYNNNKPNLEDLLKLQNSKRLFVEQVKAGLFFWK